MEGEGGREENNEEGENEGGGREGRKEGINEGGGNKWRKGEGGNKGIGWRREKKRR